MCSFNEIKFMGFGVNIYMLYLKIDQTSSTTHVNFYYLSSRF